MAQDTENIPYRKGTVLFFSIVGLAMAQPIINGLTLTIMWEWFVQKLFPAIPSLSVPLAIGLTTTARLFQGWNINLGLQDKQQQENKTIQKLRKIPDKKINNVFLNGLLDVIKTALAVLLIGWITRQFL